MNWLRKLFPWFFRGHKDDDNYTADGPRSLQEAQQGEVCDFCGGNCGQCGTSVGQGSPASMAHMISRL